MKLHPLQLEQFDRDGYLFFPSLFTAEEIRRPARRSPASLRTGPAGERARKGQRRRADQLRRAHVQRSVRPARPAPAHGRARDADPGRARVHAPVQDQRQDGLRRRRLAMAPGLRHLEERRPHARGARDERGDLSRRGQRVQWPADVHPGQPQAGRDRRRPRRDDDQLSAVDDRPRHHPEARRARRPRRPQGPAGVDDPLPLLPRPRLDVQPVARGTASAST